MHKFKKFKLVAILVMIFATCANFLAVIPASAADVGTDLENRILLNSLRKCYRDGYMNTDVTIGMGVDPGSGEVSYNDVETSIFPISKKKPESYYLTSDNNPIDKKLYCKDLLSMFYPKQFPTVMYGENNIRTGSSDSDVKQFLTNIGYETTERHKSACVKLLYGRGSIDNNGHQIYFDNWNTLNTLAYICWANADEFDLTHQGVGVDSDAQVFRVQRTPKIPEEDAISYATDSGGSYTDGIFINIESEAFYDYYAYPTLFLEYNQNDPNRIYFRKPDDTYDHQKVRDSHHVFCGYSTTNMLFFAEIVEDVNSVPGFDPTLSFTINGWRNSVDKFIGQFEPDYSTENQMIPIGTQQAFDLYAHYLVDYYGTKIDVASCGGAADHTKVYTNKGWCPIFTRSMHHDDSVAVFDSNLDTLTEVVNYDDLLVRAFTLVTKSGVSIDPIKIDEDGGLVDPLPSLGDRRTAFSFDDPCYNYGGSQSWILCPILKGSKNSLENLYTDTVKGYLTIDSFLLSSPNGEEGSGSGTYQAWRIFVDFANVMLVGFFLVVIFSQVTGVGIDNYGIKKALPKIIIAAVLINASFIICQLVSDLSNIIGNSIESMLAGIGDNIIVSATKLANDAPHISDGSFFNFILNLAMISAGGLAVGSFIHTGLETSWTNAVVGLIIPLLLTVLIALIAVLFFFVILGIRKAAIVLLVAISPLAMACYMMPNAKKFIFDRWFKLFRTMIIAYPLCGLLIGGSGLSSAILMSSGLTKNYLFYAINMLLMVVPFFFLPKLIKSSVGLFGDMVQKASNAVRGYGKGTKDKASNAFKNSQGYQRRKDLKQEERGLRRAERDLKNLDGKKSRFKWRQRSIDQRRAQAREFKAQYNQQMGERDLHRTAGWEAGKKNENTLATQKEFYDTQNLQDAAFVESQKFLQDASSKDELAKVSRFSKTDSNGNLTDDAKTARHSYTNRLAIDRNNEIETDKLYESQTALDYGLEANKQRAQAKRRENSSAALTAGTLEIQGIKVVAGDQANMQAALLAGLNHVDDNMTEEERAELKAGIGAIQDEMMKNVEGRDSLRIVYDRIADAGVANDSEIRNVAADFMRSYGDKIKKYNRATHAVLSDVSVVGRPVGSSDSYKFKGIDKLSAATISSYDTSYIEQIVKEFKARRATGTLTPGDLQKYNTFKEIRDNYFKPDNDRNRNDVIDKILRSF